MEFFVQAQAPGVDVRPRVLTTFDGEQSVTLFVQAHAEFAFAQGADAGEQRAESAVVGVGSKDDDAQFAVTDRRLALRILRWQTECRKRGRRDSREFEKRAARHLKGPEEAWSFHRQRKEDFTGSLKVVIPPVEVLTINRILPSPQR